MNNKLLIAGASVTAGVGLFDGFANIELFVNRLAVETLGYKIDNVNNISVPGQDNHGIFQDVAGEIVKNNYADVLICWQAIPLINFNFGLETYQTVTPLVSPQRIGMEDVKLVGGELIPKKKIHDVRMFLLRHYNLHWGILDLVKYINVIRSLAQTTNTKLHFINYSLPWDTNEYFQKNNWNVPSDLDSFSQNILNSELRSDEETRLIYDAIHQAYSDAGGINEECWLNLYNPLRLLQIDTVSDVDKHPGMQSQGAFFDYLSPILKSR